MHDVGGRMEYLKQAILESFAAEPDNFDAREALWMEREELRRQNQEVVAT